ncbi:hypothetical protein ACFOWX_00055 [Sphingorhabdus arenilitoris]|uniref:Uncharacterized protein n=1 Tax=Sphingorhabdus arenilitoris TaxID=1490041 RepID=A0ABV8RBN3_9SPHN
MKFYQAILSTIFLASCISVGATKGAPEIATFGNQEGDEIMLGAAEILIAGRSYPLADCSHGEAFCRTGFFRFETTQDCAALQPKDPRLERPMIIASNYHSKTYWLFYPESPNFIIEYTIPDGVTALFFSADETRFREFAAEQNGRIDEMWAYRFPSLGPSFACS